MVRPQIRSAESCTSGATVESSKRLSGVHSSPLIDEGLNLGDMSLGDISLVDKETVRGCNSTRHGRAGILYWLSLVLCRRTRSKEGIKFGRGVSVMSLASSERIRNSNVTRRGRAGILYWLSLCLGLTHWWYSTSQIAKKY